MKQKFNKKATLSHKKKHGEAGDAMVLGIASLVLLVLVVIGVGFYFLTHKPEVGVVYTPPTVSADDALSAGKTNNELAQDARIFNAGMKRDQEQLQGAGSVLSDQAQPIEESGAATNVQASRLSTLQTAFISEGDRRLKSLDDAAKLLPRLDTTQQTTIKKQLTDEITVITGLKSKAASETTIEAFMEDKTALDKEYGNYLLVLAQTYMFVWANGQTALETKVNVLGGKFQERVNDGSSSGDDVAQAQILINTFQAGKTTAIGLTADALKAVTAVKPGDYNANRSVLKTYYSKLSNAHDELNKSLTATTGLVNQISTFK